MTIVIDVIIVVVVVIIDHSYDHYIVAVALSSNLVVHYMVVVVHYVVVVVYYVVLAIRLEYGLRWSLLDDHHDRMIGYGYA